MNTFTRRRLSTSLWQAAVVAVALLLVAPAGPAGATSSMPPPNPGWYTLTTHYRGDIPSVRGWTIEWQVPEVTNPGGDTSGAVGQWFWNLESGFYYFAGGWWVYYYGDNGDQSDNNPSCTSAWGSGAMCFAWPLTVGQHVVFTYEYCGAPNVFDVNGATLCVYADLGDGAGRRYLARDVRTTQEMYAHDIETFADQGSGDQEDPFQPRISCAAPTTMVAQQIRWGSGPYQAMSGTQWRHQVAEDVNALYDYQNINLTTTPARWESCTPSQPTVCATNHLDARTYWNPATAYTNPAEVYWNRRVYRAKWYTQGEIPGSGAAWQDLGPCGTV